MIHTSHIQKIALLCAAMSAAWLIAAEPHTVARGGTATASLPPPATTTKPASTAPAAKGIHFAKANPDAEKAVLARLVNVNGPVLSNWPALAAAKSITLTPIMPVMEIGSVRTSTPNAATRPGAATRPTGGGGFQYGVLADGKITLIVDLRIDNTGTPILGGFADPYEFAGQFNAIEALKSNPKLAKGSYEVRFIRPGSPGTQMMLWLHADAGGVDYFCDGEAPRVGKASFEIGKLYDTDEFLKILQKPAAPRGGRGTGGAG
jgi:hypothetical protein